MAFLPDLFGGLDYVSQLLQTRPTSQIEQPLTWDESLPTDLFGGFGSWSPPPVRDAWWQMPTLGASQYGTFTDTMPSRIIQSPIARKRALQQATAATSTPSQGGDIWGIIDEEAGNDPQLAQALKLAVQLESGGRADAVGDQGQSYGYYQIHQPAHGQNITPEQSRDPRRATQYRLAEFRTAKERVTRERPGLWESDPMEAAALTAFYAQRPAAMYGAANVRNAWTTVQQRQAAPRPPGPISRTGGQWDHLVPGGQGRIERGGTHGGFPAIDIFAPAGTPIFAPTDGLSDPGQYPLGGNATTLRGADGRYYYFAHAQAPMRGGQVKKGDIIGYVGNTGNARSTPSHLHYAVATNPAVFDRYNGSGDLDPT